MNSDIEKVLVSEEEINEANKRLGKELMEEYAGKNPLKMQWNSEKQTEERI